MQDWLDSGKIPDNKSFFAVILKLKKGKRSDSVFVQNTLRIIDNIIAEKN